MSITIKLEGRRQADGTVPTATVDVPALPQIGGYVSYDKIEGLAGRVDNVDFWWDEDEALTITVQIR